MKETILGMLSLFLVLFACVVGVYVGNMFYFGNHEVKIAKQPRKKVT